MSISAQNGGDPALRGPRHARRHPSKRPVVAALLGLSGFFALLVYGTIGGGAVAQAAGTHGPHPSGVTTPSGTTTVSVKPSSITDAKCEGDGTVHTGVYLVLNQIDQADAPASVHVFYDPSGEGDAPRVKNNQNESAYSVTFPAGVTGITDATAVVPAGWTGSFVVSHYLCGSPSTTPSTPETTPVTTPPSSPETTPSTPETTPSTPETTPSTPETTPSTPETTPSTPETTPSSTTETSTSPAASTSAPSSAASEATGSSSSAFVPGPGQTSDSRPSGGSPLKTIMLGLGIALPGAALTVLVQPYLRRRGIHA